MAITAALVKELRERTGAGMMECKKALVECHGDIDAAAELMRKQGAAKADKKAGRVAAEGLIGIARSDDGKALAMVEINCETDFVAKDEHFKKFVAAVAEVALNHAPADVDALSAAPMPNDGRGGGCVEEGRKALIAKIGENISVRRFQRLGTDDQFGVYVHGARIGVVVETRGGDETLAKDIAMHVAASKPMALDEASLDPVLVAKEKEILLAQVADSGKPAQIMEKMVEGRMRKFFAENTLLGQAFVKDPDMTVGALAAKAGAEIVRYVRMEVGEGIEKKQENFADEVMAQVRGG